MAGRKEWEFPARGQRTQRRNRIGAQQPAQPNLPCQARLTLSGMERRRIFVRGIVQGVGFRPFLFGLAARTELTGFVANRSDGVCVEVQGAPAALEAFVHSLRMEAPPLAMIDEIRVEDIAPFAESEFRIVESVSEANLSTPISPDIATCEDCLRELFDPNDRRYRYPFINCTNCGPRFTIIRDIPYDRPNTTMAVFPMCAACEAEYHSPTNRRFHAQPNACRVCGPKVWFEKSGKTVWEEGAIASVHGRHWRGVRLLRSKGSAGFHLAVDARNEDAVALLRVRKGRRDKPFALMARDLEAIAQYALLGDEETHVAAQ